MVPESSEHPQAISARAAAARFGKWAASNPAAAALLAAIGATLVYFFCFYKVFTNGGLTAAQWASDAWNSENDLEHGWLILPVALVVVWLHRAKLAAARREPSVLGIVWVLFGVALFVLSARTLQPRIALLALPLLGYGITRFLWGREAARVVIFPCAFLLFMVPVGFLVSRTVGLQTAAATVAAKLSTLIGIAVDSDGATLRARDGSFQFEVAGGCSGIRSLTAMTVLAALYVHFTVAELWKKVVIFASSLLFAVLGNFVRIFSVVLFARLISVDLATGLYHDYSGLIFFPIAVSAMVGFGKLLDRDWKGLAASPIVPQRPGSASSEEREVVSVAPAEPKSGGPISYDY